MSNSMKFYIDGAWVDPVDPKPFDVINPATEEAFAQISLGNAEDVDRAVQAAKRAFPSWSQTTKQERLELFDAIMAAYKNHYAEMADAISKEMGAPATFAQKVQAATGIGHFKTMSKLLAKFEFDEDRGTTRLSKEPIGVCGMITPWNWPVNQIAAKVAPALAAGCTMVLKPSEIAPMSGIVFAEILHEAGVPKGVFNMVNGDGPGVGSAISSHPDVDMVSFTGSTRAGVAVAQNAAPTVKRVSQELGGKSANIILDDADFQKAVFGGVLQCFGNTGQSCNAPTRMLVPMDRMEEAGEIAKAAAAKVRVGDPADENTTMGPLVSKAQWDKVQGLIQKGIDEGATPVVGGTGLPEGVNKGYFARPTVFTNVTNDMTIAREEIFGPVLSILGYKDDADAVSIANDTPYGLSGYVSGAPEHAQAIAKQLRTGNVHVNGAMADVFAPFGGYKQSGNGREWGEYGLEEYLEVKAIMGHNAA
ncbi:MULTISPECIES: aldehyde dehydrogenase family protein [unclassified Minwuia]|jgi:aldehyde dehydrogenase (NAD+)|uniref:aldehyde dehydrogenase family protein n=1 Tax=unclassified Minwuia TaxID=2618799 RepID=UPI00247A51DB|nr:MULTISPECIES: aldehyde dehydrogenase family protein [unclassified Minwuia]